MRIHPRTVLAAAVLGLSASPALGQSFPPDSRVVVSTRVRPDGAAAARLRPVCDTSRAVGETMNNTQRLALDELLGSRVTRLAVEGVSADWRDTAQVVYAAGVMLGARPQRLARGPSWSESSWSPEFRILGRVHYENGHVGRFQLAHFVHVCIEDADGGERWFRLLPGELWPRGLTQSDEGTYELSVDDQERQRQREAYETRPVRIGSYVGMVEAGVDVAGELGGEAPPRRRPRIYYREYGYRARAGERFVVTVSSAAFQPYVEIGHGPASGHQGFLKADVTPPEGEAKASRAEHTSLNDYNFTIRVGSIVDERTGPFTLRIERQR
jgi:hypothetical protein